MRRAEARRQGRSHAPLKLGGGVITCVFPILRSPKIMFRSLAIRAGLLCLVLAPLATVASAQLKVAVVNVQKAMLDSDELKKVSADVEARYKPRQDELL